MADRYFVGDTDSDWNDASNWAATSGGAGGAGVPGSGDVAIFDGNSPDCTLDMSTTVSKVDIQSGFSNTLDMSTYNLTCGGSDAFSIAAGTFTGGAGQFYTRGTVSMTGGTFNAPSGTWVHYPPNGVAGYITFNGVTFNHQNGLVIFDAYYGFSINKYITFTTSVTFHQLHFSGHVVTGGYTYGIKWQFSGTSCIVEDKLMIKSRNTPQTEGSASINNGTIYLRGDLETGLYSWEGSGVIEVDGASEDQEYITNNDGTFNAGRIHVNKASGKFKPASGTTIFRCSTFQLTSGEFEEPTGTFEVYHDYTRYSAVLNLFDIDGGTYTQACSYRRIRARHPNSGVSYSISPEGMTFDHLVLGGSGRYDYSGCTITVTGSNKTATVTGDFTFLRIGGGSGYPSLNSGTIYCQGDVTVENCDPTDGSGIIEFSGSEATQELSLTGYHGIAKFIVNKSSGSVIPSGTITFYDELEVQSGTFDFNDENAGFSSCTLDQQGGIINCGSGTISLTNSNFTKSGGTFNAETSFFDFYRSSSGTNNISGSPTFYDLKLRGATSGGFTEIFDLQSGTVTVSNEFSYYSKDAAGWYLRIINGTIECKGDVTNLNPGRKLYGSSATLKINGTGSQTVKDLDLNGVNIVLDNSDILLTGTPVFTSCASIQVLQVFDPGTSSLTVYLYGHGDSTFSGVDFNLYNLSLNHGASTGSNVIDLGGNTITVLNNCSSHLNGGWSCYYNNGTIDVKGDLAVTVGDNLVSSSSTGLFKMSGSADANLSGVITAKFFNLEIAKDAGKTVTLTSDFGIALSGKYLIVTSGILDLAGYNLTVNGALTIGASGKLKLHGDETISKGSISSSGTVEFYDSGSTADVGALTNDFVNLILGEGKTHVFNSGTAYTISGLWSALGTKASRTVIKASTPGTQFTIDTLGSSDFTNNIVVYDCDASAVDTISAIGSVGPGLNNINWYFGATTWTVSKTDPTAMFSSLVAPAIILDGIDLESNEITIEFLDTETYEDSLVYFNTTASTGGLLKIQGKHTAGEEERTVLKNTDLDQYILKMKGRFELADLDFDTTIDTQNDYGCVYVDAPNCTYASIHHCRFYGNGRYWYQASPYQEWGNYGIHFAAGPDASSEKYVYNNLFRRFGYYAIQWIHAAKTEVYNNTFVKCQEVFIWWLTLDENAKVWNNIFVVDASYAVDCNQFTVFQMPSNPDPADIGFLDYNLYQFLNRGLAVNMKLWVGSNWSAGYDDLATFQAAFPTLEIHSIEADPKFREYCVDYHIDDVTSPAMDSAFLLAPIDDNDRRSRGYPDRGCYDQGRGKSSPQWDEMQNATVWMEIEDTRDSGDVRNVRITADYARLL